VGSQLLKIAEAGNSKGYEALIKRSLVIGQRLNTQSVTRLVARLTASDRNSTAHPEGDIHRLLAISFYLGQSDILDTTASDGLDNYKDDSGLILAVLGTDAATAAVRYLFANNCPPGPPSRAQVRLYQDHGLLALTEDEMSQV
jgi:hypothetical protein